MHVYDIAVECNAEERRRDRNSDGDGRRRMQLDSSEQCSVDNNQFRRKRDRKRDSELHGAGESDNIDADRNSDDSRKDIHR